MEVQFEVQLIKTPPIDKLSSRDVFELMCQAKYVAGQYWIFEGDCESLHVCDCCVVADGITSGTSGLEGEGLIEHCQVIFDYDLSEAPRSHQILRALGRL